MPSSQSAWRTARSLTLLLALSGAPALAQERIGAAVDLFSESGTLNGSQSIDGRPTDETFEYEPAGNMGFSAWILFLEGERLRWGPALRYVGRYKTETEDVPRVFDFGTLLEGTLEGEYSLPIVEKFHGVLGIRGGLAMLIPQGDLAEEIRTLRADGVGVWNVPRPGWTVGLSLGVRRALTESLAFRADLRGQWEQLFLFRTTDDVDGFEVEKRWTTTSMRMGLTLGLEFVL